MTMAMGNDNDEVDYDCDGTLRDEVDDDCNGATRVDAICEAQAAAHCRWRGIGGAFRCTGGRTGAVHLTMPAMAPTRREVEAVRRDAMQQPAGVNKEEGSRMDACGGCLTKCDARWRHATTGNATTSR